ncbi:MAG: AbrB/MazE/SpoVT family DNA-binding domain-containing protein [Candidatus Heimdallarchaeota archaeon]|nr:AbrB/MazE/SpoVT family DNA-binding domain-containing protein [Candidatus Heimdallarchaeota archaeon]
MKFLGSAKIVTKSQITIPKTVREELHLDQGDDLIFLQDESGLIYITKEVEIKIPKEKD